MTDYWMHIGSGRITSSSGKDIGVFTGDFRYRDQLIVAVNAEAKLRDEIASLKEHLQRGKEQEAYLHEQLAECKKDAERWKDELFSVLVQDMTRPSALKRIEEIAAMKEEA